MTKTANSKQQSVVSGQPKVTEGVLRTIALERLNASLRNPRRTMNDADLEELAASIRQHGVQVPLLVRQVDTEASEESFEIVCGHRRSDAATMAGLTEVPCIVRDLDDETADEIALVDNVQRVDIPPMEEAEAFNTLLARLGSISALAAKVGKEIGYVAKRLKLCALTCWSQDALRARLISVDHAMLLARLADDEQNAALKWCIDRNAGSKTTVDKVIADRMQRRSVNDNEDDDDTEQAVRRARWRHEWEPESVQRLKEHIECESGLPLDRAPWSMEEDWLLPDAGSCLDCEKNTKANAPLFGDLDMGVAVCTDGACFKAKTIAFIQIQTTDEAKRLSAAAKIPGKSSSDFVILRLSWKPTGTVPRQLKDGGINLDQVFKAGQWVEAKKKCGAARSAVTVDWSDAGNRGYMGHEEKLRKPGEILQVCIDSQCSVHPKEYVKQQGQAARAKAEKRDPEAEKRARETAEFREKHEIAIRNEVFAAIVPKIDAKAVVESLVEESWNVDHERKDRKKKYPQASPEQIDCVIALGDVTYDFFRADGEALTSESQVADERKALWAFAKRVGVDADAIAAAHFWRDGSIAPSSQVLYPKGVAWPKDARPAAEEPAKKTAAKKVAKPAAKPAKKTAVKGRKR